MRRLVPWAGGVLCALLLPSVEPGAARALARSEAVGSTFYGGYRKVTRLYADMELIASANPRIV